VKDLALVAAASAPEAAPELEKSGAAGQLPQCAAAEPRGETARGCGRSETASCGERVSPRSGRMKIAQQFTAGISAASRQEVREADG